MAVRIGETMIQLGLLREEQVEAILESQREQHRPFGEIAEKMFGLSEADVEHAWSKQYAQIAEQIDPSEMAVDAWAASLVDRRQAWQFRILPIRRDGAEVMVATTAEHLARAMRFALRMLREPCYFVIAEEQALGEALCRHFPMPGMTPEHVARGTMRTRFDGNAAA